MSEKKDEPGFKSGIAVGIVGTMFIVIAALSTGKQYRLPVYRLQPSSEVRMVDVNRDGIDDIVQRDGSVEFGTKDGTFTPLENAVSKEVQDVDDKYKKMIRILNYKDKKQKTD